MKNTFKKIISFAAFVCIVGAVLPVSAQGLFGPPQIPGNGGGTVSDQQLGLQYGSLSGLSARDPRLTAALLIRTALGVLGTVAVVIMVYAGFLWMTAGGNDEKVGEAKKWIYASVIGLAIILSAYALANFVVYSLVGATGFGVIEFY